MNTGSRLVARALACMPARGLPLTIAAASRPSPRPPGERPRARDLGLAPGVFPPGPLNAITDVAGVRVGHTTIVEGDAVRTGVTAILPHGGNLFQDKVAGAVFVGNAFGKLAGSTQVAELGTIETPIVLTNTLSVGTAIEAVVRYTLAQPGNERVQSVNAVVGETNDGGLNDIRGLHVTRDHVLAAIRARRRAAPVAEGSVGAGTGTQCYGWKGGIGTSSRVLPARYGGYTLGVLVQTNFGGVLTMGGAPVGKELGRYSFAPPRTDDVGSRDQPGRLLHDRRRHRRARSTRATCGAWPRARSSASPAPARPTATAAATSRSRSPRRPRCARRSASRSPGSAPSCRPTACRRCSRRRSRPPRRRSTTRCSAPRRSRRAAGPSRRSRSNR